jgi:hypothetical protein
VRGPVSESVPWRRRSHGGADPALSAFATRLRFSPGFAAFMNILENPRFQDIRSLDVVRLIAIGACWGVAVAGLAMLIGSKFRKS